MTRPRQLICCCCGHATLGRQWWNRDTGFGLCDDCIELCHRSITDEDMQSCYGKRGYHYDLSFDFRVSKEAAEFNRLGCERALMLTHECNGDKHPKFSNSWFDEENSNDKNECAKLWGRDADELGEKMTAIAKSWGFHHLDFGVGMYPTLQRSASDTLKTEHFPYV